MNPLYKKAETANPTNYRSTSITTALSIKEKIYKAQMEDYLHAKNLLVKTQLGFREKYSTTDGPVYFTERIRKELNDKKLTRCDLLDLSKAFHSKIIPYY